MLKCNKYYILEHIFYSKNIFNKYLDNYILFLVLF